MERDVAERFEHVETTVLDLARSMAQQVEASDARMSRVETNLLRLSDVLGNFARSTNEFVAASHGQLTRIEAGLARLEQNMARMEQDLGALVRTVAAERGNGHSQG
jgi:hypothetical protein